MSTIYVLRNKLSQGDVRFFHSDLYDLETKPIEAGKPVLPASIEAGKLTSESRDVTLLDDYKLDDILTLKTLSPIKN